MLDGQDPRRQRFDRVIAAHGHSDLKDDGPRVELGCHEVYGRPADFYAVLIRLALGVGPGKCWQQRRMNIENGPGKRVAEDRTDKTHEPGKAHERDMSLPKGGDEREIVGLSGRIVAVRQDDRVDAHLACPLQPRRVSTIRNHDSNPSAQPTSALGVNQRLKVAASSGDQDRN